MISNTPKDQRRQYSKLLQKNLTCELPPTYRSVCYAECDLAETMDQLIEEQSNVEYASSGVSCSLDATELIELILGITNNKKDVLFERKRNNIPNYWLAMPFINCVENYLSSYVMIVDFVLRKFIS